MFLGEMAGHIPDPIEREFDMILKEVVNGGQAVGLKGGLFCIGASFIFGCLAESLAIPHELFGRPGITAAENEERGGENRFEREPLYWRVNMII